MMDLKPEDKLIAFFLEDFSPEVCYNVAGEELSFDEWIDADEHFETKIVGVDEDYDTVDLTYNDLGIIYFIPREFFSAVFFLGKNCGRSY
jgi:hypothetical protein